MSDFVRSSTGSLAMCQISLLFCLGRQLGEIEANADSVQFQQQLPMGAELANIKYYHIYIGIICHPQHNNLVWQLNECYSLLFNINILILFPCAHLIPRVMYKLYL